MIDVFCFFFFFFQAEDGIRDLYVTGVQTCALPIWNCKPGSQANNVSTAPITTSIPQPRRGSGIPRLLGGTRSRNSRSEERRVGKECRSRWSPADEKKKTT